MPRVAVARNTFAIGIPDIGDATAHACGKVAPRLAEDHHAPAGHVLAAVVAHAFDHRLCTTVANGEPLRGTAAVERLAAGRTVQANVADDMFCSCDWKVDPFGG